MGMGQDHDVDALNVKIRKGGFYGLPGGILPGIDDHGFSLALNQDKISVAHIHHPDGQLRKGLGDLLPLIEGSRRQGIAE